MTMLVGVNEAARRLGVGPSTVSRQLARFTAGGMLTRGAGGTFDFETFKQLRDGTLNPLMARNVDTPQEPAPPSEPPAEPPPTPARMDALRTAHAAEKGFTAELKRIELLERTGRICDQASVAAAGADAARALVEQLENRRRALAEEIVAMTNADDIEARLAEADRAMIALLRQVAERAAADRAPVALEAVA